MQTIRITQHILDVIKSRKVFFEMSPPKLNEEWIVKDIKSYPAFSEPCVELEHPDGRWMRLMLSDVKETLSVSPQKSRTTMDFILGAITGYIIGALFTASVFYIKYSDRKED